MADLDRIKRNVAKMAAQNAPEADIDGYIASEGVTIEDVRNFRARSVDPATNQPPGVPAAPAEPKQDRLPAADAWSPTADADLAESISGTGTFADMTGSGIAKAIPFADEIVSGLSSPFRAAREWYQGEGFDISRAYDRNMQVEEELQRRRSDRSPIASVAGQIAGGVGAAAPLAAGGFSFLTGARPTLASMAGRGAAEGAAYGAAYGAGEGRGVDERLRNTAWGAGMGAGTGAATGALGRIGAGRVADDTIPSIDQMRTAKNAAYDATDNLGVRYEPAAFRDLVADIVNDARAKSLNPARHPRAASLITDLVKEARAGTAPTIRQLDEYRQIIYRDIGMDGGEQFFGNRMAGKIDDFIENAGADSALTGDPSRGAAAVQEARELNRRYSNARTVDKLLEKAERRAKANNSGGNTENKVRQNLAGLLDNDKKSKFLNASEREAIETVIRGTLGQNAARSLGNWAKGFGGHSLAGGSIAAAIMTGNPLPLAGAVVPYMAGSGLKAISRGMGNANERAAESLIRTGQNMSPEISQIRQAIVEALTRGGAVQIPASIGQ